jgi:hypothetical protein
MAWGPGDQSPVGERRPVARTQNNNEVILSKTILGLIHSRTSLKGNDATMCKISDAQHLRPRPLGHGGVRR